MVTGVQTCALPICPAPPVWKPLAAGVTVIAGLAVMANAGVVNESGVTWWWPLLPAVGLWVFGVVGAVEKRDFAT